ncbi:hypothetical protein Aperf_G00000004914 [Anoplocephala perfoliata]
MDKNKSSNSLQHVGLQRPRRPKNHQATTIIHKEGEKIEHEPLTTDDLFATPAEYLKVESDSSDEKKYASKPMRNMTMTGFALPGLGQEPIKLRSYKSEGSPNDSMNFSKLGEPVINGKENHLTHFKLKPVSSRPLDDKKKQDLAGDSLEEQRNNGKDEQGCDNENLGALKNNPFLLADRAKRGSNGNALGPSKTASSLANNKEENLQQKSKSMVPTWERQSSNQEKSEANVKTSPPTFSKMQPVDGCLDQSGTAEYVNITNLTEKVPPTEKTRISATETISASPAGASGTSTEKRKSAVMKKTESPITDFSSEPASSHRKSGNENESNSEDQPRLRSGKRNSHSSNRRKCTTLIIETEPQSSNVHRPLSQITSSTEGKSETEKSNSEEKIEAYGGKPHSPAQSATSSSHSTSSTSTELSKAPSDTKSIDNICKKSDSCSASLDASSGKSKSDEPKPNLDEDSPVPASDVAENTGPKRPAKRRPKAEKNPPEPLDNVDAPDSDHQQIEEEKGKDETDFGKSEHGEGPPVSAGDEAKNSGLKTRPKRPPKRGQSGSKNHNGMCLFQPFLKLKSEKEEDDETDFGMSKHGAGEESVAAVEEKPKADATKYGDLPISVGEEAQNDGPKTRPERRKKSGQKEKGKDKTDFGSSEHGAGEITVPAAEEKPKVDANEYENLPVSVGEEVQNHEPDVPQRRRRKSGKRQTESLENANAPNHSRQKINEEKGKFGAEHGGPKVTTPDGNSQEHGYQRTKHSGESEPGYTRHLTKNLRSPLKKGNGHQANFDEENNEKQTNAGPNSPSMPTEKPVKKPRRKHFKLLKRSKSQASKLTFDENEEEEEVIEVRSHSVEHEYIDLKQSVEPSEKIQKNLKRNFDSRRMTS